ncbi:MAG: hypothetical protein ACE37H_08835 [Phycisphaeraceae bacterium]
MKTYLCRSLAALSLGVLSFATVPAVAGDRSGEALGDEGYIVIRRTIPNPRAVDRAPLTSERLSTTSTRYIDARRGHRPYDTVHSDRCGFGHARRVLVGYDDHFGITRPEDRPYSYSQRTPRTGVTTITNPMHRDSEQASDRHEDRRPMVVAIRDERAQADRPPAVRPANNAPDMRVRIHHNEPELPTRSGAVLITADGTVIQVGD